MKFNDSTVHVFTDGSANNHEKSKGGYGFVAIYKGYERHKFGGSYSKTTSARMEIKAVLEALKFIKPKFKVIIYSDCEHVVKAIKKEWIYNWEKQGFQDRKNADLWVEILNRLRQFPMGYVRFKWLRGHNGHEYNELADSLAKKGAHSSKKLKDL